jgi:hypothetical protein
MSLSKFEILNSKSASILTSKAVLWQNTVLKMHPLPWLCMKSGGAKGLWKICQAQGKLGQTLKTSKL